MIRRLLHGMPTRPAFALAAFIAVAAVGGYYTVRYQDCSDHAAMREQVYTAIKTKLGGTVSLAKVVPFAWIRLSVLMAYKPRSKLPECPFGWDWSRQYRRSLAELGALNMLVFNRQGNYLDYIDFRDSQLTFNGISASYTPKTALFTVARQAGNSGGFVLTPVP